MRYLTRPFITIPMHHHIILHCKLPTHCITIKDRTQPNNYKTRRHSTELYNYCTVLNRYMTKLHQTLQIHNITAAHSTSQLLYDTRLYTSFRYIAITKHHLTILYKYITWLCISLPYITFTKLYTTLLAMQDTY